MKNKTLNKITAWALIAGLTMQAAPVWALSKDETIYAKLNSDGSTSNVIVSEHVSDYGNNSIKDKSNLNNIKNVSGDEIFKDNNGEIVWETNGKDVYYQGTTEDEMPVGVSIKYYLNGEEKELDEMIGKSGNVKIVLNYENRLKHTVLVNGKYEELYTPFVIATTTILSNEEVKNINVTNGKVIDNGNSSIVLALASPGLSKSLDLDMLDSLDEISISYDTDDFELSSIYSVATSKLFSESDLDIFDKTDVLYDAINTLSSSSKELVDGSNKLYNALSEMIGSGNTLSEEQLKTIEQQAVLAATLSVDDVRAKIQYTLGNIKISDKELNKAINEAIRNLEISDEEKEILKKVISENLEIDSNKINEALVKATENIRLTDEQKEIIINKVLESVALSDEEIDEITKMAVSQAMASVRNSDEYKNAMNAKNAMEQAGIENVIKVCTADNVSPDAYEMCVKNINNIANYKQLVASINTMEATASKVANGVSVAITSQINEKIENQITKLLSDEMIKQVTNEIINKTTDEINQVLKTYVTDENIDKVIDEINKKLEENISDKVSAEVINQIMPVVSEKVSELVAPKLTPVVNKITNEVASKVSTQVASTVADQVKDNVLTSVNSQLITLVKGLEKFDSEGIQKLASTINRDVKNIEARVEALIDLSNEYKTMDDIDDDASGSSKIIMIIDEVKKENDKKVNNEKIVEEKKSFGEKIKGLFTK